MFKKITPPPGLLKFYDRVAYNELNMNNLLKTQLALAIIGITISAYLFSVKTFSLDPVCGVSSCGVVNNSVYSMFLGVPISAWGMFFYFMVVVLVFELDLASLSKPSLFDRFYGVFIKKGTAGSEYFSFIKLINVFVTAFGVLFSAYLTYLEAFVINAWCQWCIASAWITVCLLVLALRILRLPRG